MVEKESLRIKGFVMREILGIDLDAAGAGASLMANDLISYFGQMKGYFVPFVMSD